MSYADNKRVARNTLYLYIRTFIAIVVSLYTSRKILEALGVDDFGVMNVVGGIITLMAFINGSMSVATQRYLTYELGRGEKGDFNRLFSMAVYIHAIIAVVVLVAAETIGLWVVNTHLNIPEPRMGAANWIYQATIMASILGILQTPYNAAIVSYEHMHIYAYIGLGETFAKLLIVLALLIYPYDRLAIWGFALLALQCVVAIFYRIYCMRRLDGCRVRMHAWDNSLFRSMLGFTGWNMFGTVAWTLKGQGTTVLLNIFGGPVYNAAYGVSCQVTGAIRNLISGFQSAVNPQITKTYAANDIAATCRLLCKSSKISYFLMFIVSLPVLFEIDFIMGFWLVEVPEFAPLFTRLVIVESLFDTLAGPMITSLMATGRIKWYQIVVGTILLFNIPVTYMLLKLGCHIATPLVVSIVFMFLGNASRLMFCRNMLGQSLRVYLRDVVVPILTVSIISIVPTWMVYSHMEQGWLRLISLCAMSIAVVSALVFSIGFSRTERTFVINILRPRLVRIIPTRS